MSTRNSASARAEALRAGARRGVWQSLLAALGVRTGRVRRADAVAARWEHVAAGEAETARLVAALGSQGWGIRHDLRMPGSRANLDHLLVSPCGTAVVVHVLGPARLVPTLAAAPKVHDQVRAAAVAARVDRVLTPYA